MRFVVATEKVAGTRLPNYVVKDTATQEVKYRTADKDSAESVASRANMALAES